MPIRKVARMGHPVLREKCRPIDPARIRTPEVQGLIRDMLETMVEYNGVGLAAPQVHEPVRLCIAGGSTDADGRVQLRVLINPEITVLDAERREGMYEGCLSIPGLRGWVERPAHVNVKGYDERGERLDFDLEGYPAIVVQHECDHLDGILYIDRMDDPTRLGFEEEVQRYHDLGAEDDDDEDDDEDDEDARSS